MKIFISYSREDSAIVHLLMHILEKNNIQCLIDRRLPSARSFDTDLQNMIQEANLFVVLLTNTSLNSQWVQQEIGYAKGLEKTILPLAVEEEIQPTAMIRDIQVSYLGNWTYFSRTIDDLIKGLHSAANESTDRQQELELDRIITGRNERTEFITKQLQRLLNDKNRKLKIYNQAIFSSFAISDAIEYRDGEPGDCSDEYMGLLLEEKQLLQELIVQPRTTFKLLLCPVPFGYREHSIRYKTLLNWMYDHQNIPNVDYRCGNYVSPNRLIVLEKFCIEARFHPSSGYEYNVVMHNPQKIKEVKEEFEFVYKQATEADDTKAKAIQQIRLRSAMNEMFSIMKEGTH